jgi:hypothetical protein
MFELAFLAMMGFLLLCGVTAIIFVSFDAKPQAGGTSTQRLSTGTIQTVDSDGTVQQWTLDSSALLSND